MVEFFKCVDFLYNIELVDSNFFIWVVIYFGKFMMNFDGGLFRFRFYFSFRFLEE